MSANRLAALTGLAFVVLAVISAIIMGEPPDPDDPPLKIIAFYKDNDTELWISAFLTALAATALVFFAGYLGRVLRIASGPGHMLSWVVLAGATITAFAAALDATIIIALVESVDDQLPPVVIQTLNSLYGNDWIPFVVGGTIFSLAAGLSIVRHGGLPSWMGWIAIVLGVVSATPAGFVGFLGAGVWIAVASVMLFLRADEPDAPGAVPPPAPAPTQPI
jgi:hypothetical protein